MGVRRKIFKEDVGKFGKIIAGDKNLRKTMFGTVFYVDNCGAVIFIDNDDISHRFKIDQIEEFTECEFKINIK
jgi:hypothetical protein